MLTPAQFVLSVTRNHSGTIVNCSVEGVPEDWSDWDLRGEFEAWVEDTTTPDRAVEAARLVLTTPMVSMSDRYQRAKGIRIYVDNDWDTPMKCEI